MNNSDTSHAEEVVAGFASPLRFVVDLLGILVLAVVLRLLFFTGLGAGDDVIYVTQTLAHAVGGAWPPHADHWSTRLGVTGPTTLFIWLFGPNPWGFLAFPFLISLVKVVFCYGVALAVLRGRFAALAVGIFAAVFPMDVIYASHLFPDTLNGFFSSVALVYWIRLLRTEQIRDGVVVGMFLGLAYLCHETVILQAPIYIGLWLFASRRIRPAFFMILIVPTTFVVAEAVLYWATTGEPLYRFSSMLAQQENPKNLAVIFSSTSGGGIWTDPLLMLISSHEYGLLMIAAMICAIAELVRGGQLRGYALWLLIGYVWSYYGTTVPHDWVPLARDPRYTLFMTLPAALLLAQYLALMTSHLRTAALVLLAVTSAGAAALERGSGALEPYRKFAQSEFAERGTMLPYDYVIAHYVAGFERSVEFGYGPELGCGSRHAQLSAVANLKARPLAQAKHVAISGTRNRALLADLRSAGWSVVAEFPGEPSAARALVGQILKRVPSQAERAERLLSPPGLVVLAHGPDGPPAPFSCEKTQTPSKG
ncbi:MAG: glycosyltransferase family 39 protein [Pseudomonadota bacterium]